MRNALRWSTVVALTMIGCLAVFEVGVLAKKKRKRRNSRATVATQTQPSSRYVLPSLIRPATSAETTPAVEVISVQPELKAVTKRKNPAGPVPNVPSGPIIISEFRVRGPSGANDEFIELYNASGADHTVAAAVTDGSGDGYAVVASDGTTRCVIPNGTVIPNRGHYPRHRSIASRTSE